MGRLTPSAVARQLRQEASFGCCRCGSFLLEYHHIIPYAEEAHFRPEDMMALCPNCHTEISHFPREEQYKIKGNPFNVANGFPNGNLIGFANKIQIRSGNTILQNTSKIIFLGVDNIELLSFSNQDGRIFVSCFLYDEDGALLLEIQDNEWRDTASLNWDIEAKPNYLKLRQAQRRISFELTIKNGICELDAELWYKGSKFSIKNGALSVRTASNVRIDAPSMMGSEIGGVFYHNTTVGNVVTGLSELAIQRRLASA